VQEGIEGSEDVLGAIDDAVQGLVEWVTSDEWRVTNCG
jgi:hypothetical protein